MKYFWIAVGIALLILIAVTIGLQQRTVTPTSEDGRLQVAATIYPLYDIVREIAGEYAEVKLIVPPGATPHFFEFTPRQLQELQRTRILFEIGHGIDSWAMGVKNVASDMILYTVDKGITLRQTAIHDDEEIASAEDEQEDTGGIDPHYWLHLGNARLIAGNVAEGLAVADPEHALLYRENALRYQEEISTKEQELLSFLAPVRGKQILTLHDAWYYFSDNFGLIVAGTFEPAAGGEPTPQYLTRLRAKIARVGAVALFSEPQLATPSMRNFADEAGFRLGVLDPIGGSEGRATYLELMEYNTRAILAAFE